MEQENKGIWIPELGKEGEWIEDTEHYSEAAAEIVDELCEQLAKEEGMIVPVEEWEDAVDESWDWVWSIKAQRLIEAEITKWYTIGIKYWEDGDIDIHQFLTQYREL